MSDDNKINQLLDEINAEEEITETFNKSKILY
jgi:hypothetical protein